MAPLPDDRVAAELVAQTADLTRIVAGADRATAVATCPGWTIADLLAHVGQRHRWAAVVVERRATQFLPRDGIGDWELPDGDGAQAAWLAAGAQRLLDAVDVAGREPERLIWTFIGPRPASHWVRRVLHDVVIHRADASLAVGVEYVLSPELACDALSEGFELVAGMSGGDGARRAELLGTGETVHFHATDAGGEWLVTLEPDGATVSERHARADVAVRGTAADLLLIAYRRMRPVDDRIEILGDSALLDRYLAAAGF